MDEFKTRLIHHHDQWEAHCRDWIEAQDDDEMCAFTIGVMERTKSGDPWVAIMAYFALLGIFGAWINVD